MNYQTIQETGYKYLYYANNEHALLNKDTGLIEFFTACKNVASWALKFRNTHLEFCRSYNESQMLQFKRGLKTIQNYGEQHPSFMNAHKMLLKLQ